MKIIKFGIKFISFICFCLFLKSCKNSDLAGTYSGQDSVTLELCKNTYEFSVYYTRDNDNTDAILIYKRSVLKGGFRVEKDVLILYDNVNHKNYNLKIVSSEILVSNSTFLNYKPNDTLYCKRKYYSDGKTKWVEGKFNEKITIRTYEDHDGHLTKKVYYDQNRNIIKIEKAKE